MSAAGLTFTMRQDEHDRRWVADAGAAVLADDSCLFFDELAQAEKPDIMALNEFMETQIIPIAKAGINGILNARCGVMTALNPKFGRFDMHGPPLADQIDAKIPPQLFSRFDLIYLIPDVPEEKRDKEEAENILGLWQGKTVQTKDQIPLPLLQKYIAMARRKKNPKMNDAALRMIVDMYVSVRKSSNGGTISITKRALESLARLATAHAIMRLANEVTIQDAEMAIKVYEYSLKQWAVDPRTQTYDSDRATGKTKDKRNLMEEVQLIIRNQGGRCAPDIIKKEIHSKYLDVTDQQIDKLIEQMYRENIIMEAGLGKFRVV
jgi:DNA replicative helicase MCM subunit Mcm2 (Cdc46/Mcm family)